jgi:hypothetical protein
MSGKGLSNKYLICLGAMLFACTGLAVFAQAEDGLAGHWVGAVLVRPAELEFDVSLDLVEASDRKLSALLSLPGQGVKRREVQELSVDGRKISFVYEDGKDRSRFSGTLSEGGRTIEGTLAEAGKSFPFVLERRPAPAGDAEARPAVRNLSPGGAELREQFSRDDGHVRMIAILSPTCPGCQNCARIVRRYVFEKIEDPELRAYIVWEPIYPEDSRAAAEQSASLIADPRVTHFWADHRSTGSAFQKAVGLATSPAWDVVLVFNSEKRWLADGQAPVPDFFMHNLKGDELPKERRLNGSKLMEEVRAVLSRKN